MKDKYQTTFDKVEIKGKLYLEIMQNKKKIYIPYYKLNATIKLIEFIKAYMEINDEMV